LVDSSSTRKYLIYAIGEEERLFNQLYQELSRNQEYNKQHLQERFIPHVKFIETILKQGQNLRIDSFMVAHQDHWPVKTYSLLNYIYGFTEFYDPKMNLYQTAVNDGTISLIKDKEFVFGLESIYGEGKNQLERIYLKETEVNRVIQKYISDKYGSYFQKQVNDVDGTWGESITKTVLNDILQDGKIRFQLSIKLTNLKSKRGILEDHIILKSMELLESYE
jgi:hypothetical protein